MKTVTAKQARQNFSEIINEVFYGNKKVLITRSGKPVVILTSAKMQRKNHD
ncbi:MAG: type II toxin-antitoxin system Phd/YefM family antitoxin [Candidatus Levybacteria bacterium]|nr:type II toxin-antitoxin system Phd/YefM family antitoxin [Candidatus Levybacteria bacterium]